VSLLQWDKKIYNDLCPHVKLKLKATVTAQPGEGI
jgi:hypothetical protein